MGPGSILAGGRFGAMPIRRTSGRGLRLPGEIPGEIRLRSALFAGGVSGGGGGSANRGPLLTPGPRFSGAALRVEAGGGWVVAS